MDASESEFWDEAQNWNLDDGATSWTRFDSDLAQVDGHQASLLITHFSSYAVPSFTPVPEPSALGFLLAGGAFFVLSIQRRKHACQAAECRCRKSGYSISSNDVAIDYGGRRFVVADSSGKSGPSLVSAMGTSQSRMRPPNRPDNRPRSAFGQCNRRHLCHPRPPKPSLL